MVVAGAGSGKTKVLVERYVNLVEQGFKLNQILAITFTRKAALEMKEQFLNLQIWNRRKFLRFIVFVKR